MTLPERRVTFRLHSSADTRCKIRSEEELANQVGKRYQCTKCNTEMIVTKAGNGELGCCGQPMQQKQ